MHLFENMSGSTIAIIVFLAVVVVALLIAIMRKSNQTTESATHKQPLQSNLTPSYSVQTEDEDEIIAVIAAAVASLGVATGKEYRIKQVRPATGRSEWAMAGLLASTRPF